MTWAAERLALKSHSNMSAHFFLLRLGARHIVGLLGLMDPAESSLSAYTWGVSVTYLGQVEAL